MLALFKKNETFDELYLPSGDTVPLPCFEVANDGKFSNELDAAVRYAFKSGLISHSDFLAARDALMDDLEMA